MLEMGDQLKVVDVARNLIRLSGFVPDEQIPITFVGLRPGEKLFEELVGADETVSFSSVDKILRVKERQRPDVVALTLLTSELEQRALRGDTEGVLEQLRHDHPKLQAEAGGGEAARPTAAMGRRIVCRPGRRCRARLAAVPVVQGPARPPLQSPQPLRARQEEPDRPPLVSLRGMRVAGMAHPAGVRDADADRRSIPARFPFPHTAVSAIAAPIPGRHPWSPPRVGLTGPARALLVAGIAWGAFAFGAVYPWAYWPLAIAAAAVALAGLVTPAAVGWRTLDLTAVTLALAIFLVAAAAQLVPLPAATIEAISPADTINRRAAGPHGAARSRVRAAADDRSGTDASRPGGCRVAGGVDRRRSAALFDRWRSRDGIGHRRARRAARAHGHRSAAAVHRENLRLLDAVTGRQSVRSLRQQESFRRLDADGDSSGDRADLQRRLARPSWCSAGVAGETPVVVVARRQPAAAPDGGGRRHDAVALPDHVALGHGRGRARHHLRRTRLTPG